jgi:hypothetical protein
MKTKFESENPSFRQFRRRDGARLLALLLFLPAAARGGGLRRHDHAGWHDHQ